MARRSVAVWITESVHLISADGCRRMSVSGCPWPVRARSANRTVFHPVDEWGIHMEVDLCNPLAQASRVMVMRLTGATTIQCGAVSPDRPFADLDHEPHEQLPDLRARGSGCPRDSGT